MRVRPLVVAGATSLFACGNAGGGPPADTRAPLWQVKAKGGLQDVVSVAVDPSGDILVTGIFWQLINLGGQDLSSAGGADIFLAKFDSTGRHLWSRRFGGPGDDYSSGLAIDSDGSIVLTGSFASSISFGDAELTARGQADAFLVKFTPMGSALWSKRFGDSTYQSGVAIAVDPVTRDIDLGGDFITSIDLGCGALVSEGNSDVFLAQFDGSGTCRWSQRFGGPDVQETRRLVVDEKGAITLMTAIEGTVNFGGGDVVGGSNPHLALALTRLDAKGQYVWDQLVMAAHVGSGVNHATMEDSHGMALADSNLLVAVSYSEGLLGGGQDFEAPANTHLILARFGQDGAVLDHQHYGIDPGLEIESGLAITPSGHAVMGGTFDGPLNFGGGWFYSASLRTLFLAKLTPQGGHLQSFAFGDADTLWVSRSLAVSEKGIFVAGYSHPVGTDDRRVFLMEFPP